MNTQKADALGCIDYLQHCINVLCRIGMVSGKKSPVSECRTLGWDALAKLVTSHTVAESKDGPGWVPGKIDPGPRKGERVECWDVLALDIEAPAENLGSGGSGNAAPGVTKRRKELSAPPLGDVAAELEVLGWAAALATTYSHEEPAIVAGVDGDIMGTLGPRYRVVFPLSRPIESEEIKPLGLQVLAMLGLVEVADTSCLESARLFYLPTCPSAREGLAQRAIVQGKPLDVEDLLRVASKTAEAAPMVRPNAPTKNASVIDAFNEQSDMGHLLGGFGYLAKGRRWVWHGSTTGEPGVYLVPNSEPPRVVSRHANDPLHHPDHRSHDAFSVWCELQHGGDYKKAVGEAAAMLGMSNSKAPPTPIYDVSGFHAGIGGAYEQEAPTSPANGAGEAGKHAEQDGEAGFKLVSVGDVLTHPEPPHPFLWGPYVPTKALTLLSAHGGIGKSGFGLQLAVHMALGLDFLGYPTTQTNSLFLSAEDAGSIVRLRLAQICTNHSINPVRLMGKLLVLDATEAAVLWEGGGKKQAGAPTPAYDTLRTFIHAQKIGFAVVDNASDTYAGDRIDKSEVTRFVRALSLLVKPQAGAVLLLSHVNRSTAAKAFGATENYADSVAWHNAPRSRLFMEENKGGDTYALNHEKSNYGKKGPALTLQPMPECGLMLAHNPLLSGCEKNPAAELLRAANMRQLLGLVHEFWGRKEYVSPSPQSPGTNAHAMLNKEAGFPSALSKADTQSVFRDMERAGYVFKQAYTKSNRHPGERWALTPLGMDFASLEPLAAESEDGQPASTAPTASTSDDLQPGAPSAEQGEACADSVRQHIGGMGEPAHMAHLAQPQNQPTQIAA